MPDISRIDLAHTPDFRIGPLDVRPGTRQLIRDDGANEVLEPRVMQVFVALAQVDGAILTRDDLTQACWEQRVVGDDAINRVISRLRRVVETMGAGTLRIETITKVGYRLVTSDGAPILIEGRPAAEPAESAPMPAPLPPEPRLRRRVPVFIVAALLVAVIAGVGARFRHRSDDSRSVFVEALHTPPGDASARLLQQGLSAKLSQLTLGDADLSIGDADSGSDARHTPFRVTGEAQTVAGKLNASVRLIGDDGHTILWSADLSDTVDHIDPLRIRIAATIGDVLVCALGRRASAQQVLDLQTLRLFLAGCEQNDNQWAAAAAHLREVVARAPNFGPGWANLAATLALQAFEGDTAGSAYEGNAPGAITLRQESLDAAGRALALDASQPLAYLAQILAFPMLDHWFYRERLLDRAMAAAPASPVLEFWRSNDMIFVGRNEAALLHARASADLCHTCWEFPFEVSSALASVGQIAAADQTLADIDRLWPGKQLVAQSRFELAAQAGDPAEAEAMLAIPRIAAFYSPAVQQAWRALIAARRHPSPQAEQAAAQAEEAIVDTDSATRWTVLTNLVILGRIDQAFRLADTLSPADFGMQATTFSPMMLPFVRDPRFIAFARRQGFAAIWKASGVLPDFCSKARPAYDCRAAFLGKT